MSDAQMQPVSEPSTEPSTTTTSPDDQARIFRSTITDESSNLSRSNQPTVDIGTGPTRIPGTYPPEWLPDHETDSCMSCDSLFTLIKRRHHCRSCGKIFCGDCCRQRVKLLYLEKKEARVCTNCYSLIDYTLVNTQVDGNSTRVDPEPSPSTSRTEVRPTQSPKVQGVLKSSNQSRGNIAECNTSTSSSSDQQTNKQVIFADGIRPGTDLTESFPYPIPSSSENPSSTSYSLLTRQNRGSESQGSSKSKKSKSQSSKNITVCDDLGYLPPIVIYKDSSWTDNIEANSNNALINLIASQFKMAGGSKKTIQASMESRSCPLNSVIKFEEISDLIGVDNVVTFLLLKDFYLKVKLIKKNCCIDNNYNTGSIGDTVSIPEHSDQVHAQQDDHNYYWSFASDGLVRFGQNEVVLVIDKDKSDPCIPRDIFKIYLTLHELSLRRQSIENLGNLLFQDGLFGSRDTAGLLFVRPLKEHCLKNLVLPKEEFLVALILQRWEVPWSKVFPMRLLLRLGHKFDVYPYPVISLRARDPVYYEVGHTIISILGDFRNYRYSITHVDGLKVMLNKKTQKVLVQLNQSCYQQFNKVLDSSNNEHVLAWSCCPFPEASGHLVSQQNEDGQYETVEFHRKSLDHETQVDSESETILGASFIIFSGALKVNQTGQSAKISIVEDGLLIQIQSCTMAALRNAIHYMHHFDIDCENNQDALNRVEIDWQLDHF